MAGFVFILILVLVYYSVRFSVEKNKIQLSLDRLGSSYKKQQQLLFQLKEALPKDRGIGVEVYPKRGLLRLSEDFLSFREGKALPDQNDYKNLEHLASALVNVLSCHGYQKKTQPESVTMDRWCHSFTQNQNQKSCLEGSESFLDTVLIEGHTDSKPISPKAGYLDNLSLSVARASHILRLLRSCKPQLSILKNSRGESLLAASGYGSLRPIQDADPYSQRNRRIDIRFLMISPQLSFIGEKNPGIELRAYRGNKIPMDQKFSEATPLPW